ncbi:hypothetical protein I4U23_013117 [Adineta vaga]|nr:hypothetical protein I4U23_013117 [Adineta vaga]
MDDKNFKDANDTLYSFYCSKHRFKTISHFISAILIPVLLAVFTIILAFQQESIAKTNRDIDLQIASKQHQQNLDLAIDEQRNTLLVTYIDDISDLLLANNLSLNRQILNAIVYPKTLAVLRQLDSIRKGHLIQFLRNSRLIATENPTFLSLRYADFNSVRLGSLRESINMQYISFASSYLENASFISGSFSHSDFTFSRMHGTLLNSSFNYATFHEADLTEVDFSNSSVYKADFTAANLRNAKISSAKLNSVGSISNAALPNGTNGRNPNRFSNSGCQDIVHENNIEQTINISTTRTWATIVRRNRTLKYFFSGWFDIVNDLRVNFTEYDQHDIVLAEYSCTGNDFLLQNTNFQYCSSFYKARTEIQSTYHSDRYKYINGKRDIQDGTYVITLHISLGQYGTCRDVYFSIETA